MDSYQSRRFGDPPFPSPPYPHLQQQQHFPGQQPANYPPAHHFPPYTPAPAPAPVPYPPQYQHHYVAFPPPPYDASAPLHQHYYQYPPPGPAAAPPLSRPHHMPPLPPVPPPHLVPASGYPPPPNQGWADQSWPQHPGLEYPDKNYPSKEDDWAAKAKAWAAAKSVTENPLMRSEVMPAERVKDQHLYFHQQNQHVIGPPADSQQPPHHASSQHHPFYLVDQEKQATDLHGPSSYTSVSTYGHAEYNSESVAAHEDHLSPASNYGSKSFIHEQEVPYSYSSISGNTESVPRSESLQQSVSFEVQEGSFSLKSELPNYAHGENSHNIVTNSNNKHLESESRSASVPDVAGGMQMMNHDTTGNTLNSWAPSVVSGGYPQPLPSSGAQFTPHFPSQPSIPVQHTLSFGRTSVASIRPSGPVGAQFIPGIGEPVNQAIGYSADASSAFGPTERPKKAAMPKWLQEEIIKSRVAIVSNYTNQNGTSNDSLEHEDAAKSFSGVDEDNVKSTDSTKSAKDDEDDEDVIETARSQAANQEIKRILTEVLLKVTDELFDQIATKVLLEDDVTVEAKEHRKQRVSPPSAFTPRASAEVLTSVKENGSNGDGFNYKSSSPALGGDILGLASYASDEEDDEDERNRRSRSPPSGTMVQESNGGSFSANAKNRENGNNVNIIDKVDNSEALHYVETNGSRMHTDAAPERCMTNDDVTTSKENISVSVESCSDKISTVLKDIDEPDDVTDQKESTCVGYMGGDAKDAKLTTTRDEVREPKVSPSIHSYPDKRSYTKDPVSKVTTNKERKNIDSNETKFTSNKEKKDIDSNETSSHEKNIKLKEKIEKTYSLKKEKSGNETQAGESDSRRNQNSAKDARRHSTKESNENRREDIQKDKGKLRNEKENQNRRHTRDSEKHNSRRSPSPSNRSRHSKENLPHNRRNTLNDEPSDNSRKRKLQAQRDSLSPSPIKGRNRQLSRSPDRKHSHHRHSYSSTSRRRSRSSTPGRGRR